MDEITIDFSTDEAKQKAFNNWQEDTEWEADRKAQDKLYNWFNENRAKIIDGHYKEQALIKDDSVLGYFQDVDTARIAASKRNLRMGEYLIQECITPDETGICLISYQSRESIDKTLNSKGFETKHE